MKYVAVIASLLLLASCKEHVAPPATAALDIFNKEQVATFMKSQTGDKAAAETYFRQGETKLRQLKQPGTAVDLFTNSIKAYPTAKVYFELGNAYMDTKDYKQAQQAYSMAEAMDYKPLPQLLYNTACAYSLANDYTKASQYLEYAIESGYTNTKHITSDADLKSPEYGFAYDDTYLEALSGSNDEADVLWQNFKKAFVAITLPLTIDRLADAKLSNRSTLSYKYGKFVSEMQSRAQFSREGGDGIYSYALVANNASYITVIYATQRQGDEGEAANYWMVSYNNKGEQVDKLNIAGSKDPSPTSKVFTMNEDLTFQVKEFLNTYEKSLSEHGYYNNKITNTTLKDTKEYKISDAGKFVETSPRLGMK